MKILHLSWGLEPNNGAANIARMIMREQIAAGHEARIASKYSREELEGCDELWCHCGWYWRIWLAVWRAKRMGKRVKWMPECCYDPFRVRYHGWKKALVGPFERWALRKVDVIVATCEKEGEWCRGYIGKKCPKIEVEDIKRFFKLDGGEDFNARALEGGFAVASRPSLRSGASSVHGACGTRKVGRDLNAKPEDISLERSESRSDALAGVQSTSCPAVSPLRVLYLGRRHPLKGVEFLEKAVSELEGRVGVGERKVELRIVSDHTGEELERDWEWCEVLCLPTLSDNFGLVVAEALERGKSVITTDGAPAFAPNGATAGKPAQPRIVKGYEGQLLYLEGFRDGSEEARVNLLKAALKYFV